MNELYATSFVNDLWNIFNECVIAGAKKFIPNKISKKRDSLPYITTEIRKLIKRRDRLYNYGNRMRRNFDKSTSGYTGSTGFSVNLDKLTGHI